MDDIPYDVGAPEAVQKADDELNNDLNELKHELEESDMLHNATKSSSSISIPKDGGHFKRERELFLQRCIQVCEAMPLVVQADQMTKELNAARHSDYTPESLPLLLLQFFTDRMQQLIQLKYMHLVRWKRFLGNTKAVELLYSDFTQRLSDIMSEYNDCVSRAKRLSEARESYLAGENSSKLVIRNDDLFIYLRWLVTHFSSVRKFHQYMKILEWLPVVHKKDLFSLSFEDVAPSAMLPSNPVTQKQFSSDSSRSSRTGSAAGNRRADAPVHVTELKDIKEVLSALVTVYGINADVAAISSSADEMELCAKAIQKFRVLFLRQEQMKKFRIYEIVDSSQPESAVHTLKKEANWIPFINIHAERDSIQESKIVELRCRKNVDLLLQAQSNFIKVADLEKVEKALKSQASSTRESVVIQSINLPSSLIADIKTQSKADSTASIWQKIYCNPELYKESPKQDQNTEVRPGTAREKFDQSLRGRQTRATSSRAASARSRNSFDYLNAMQLLGLDDGEQDNTDPSSIQGGYLSFLLLRHLYIRDLQRTCLSILNYFRSVERTLTIDDVGLSCSNSSQTYKHFGVPSHRSSFPNGRVSSAGGIGSHHYVHYTPADYAMSESEFIECAEVDNHDDYYTIDDDGRVHVQDQQGRYIMYDEALEDFTLLEQDLLLITTHFITKDFQQRSTYTPRQQPPSPAKRVRGRLQVSDEAEPTVNEVNITGFANQEIDRFAVLLDLWSSEVAFLQSKKDLLDCYLEAYQNVADITEKRQLSQVIVNIAYQRPRFDFTLDYFVRTYQLECQSLRLQFDLIKSILVMQIVDQRHYLEKICRGDQHEFGLPHSVIAKQLISVVSNKAAISDIYMLEFHPSLAIASQIPRALKHAYREMKNMCKPESITGLIILEKKMLQWALSDWTNMPTMGGSYCKQVQKDLFSGVFADDPKFVCEVAQAMALNVEQQLAKKTQKERLHAVIVCVAKVMDVVTLRHRLMDAAWETELLSKMYKRQAMDMEYEECHLYLRPVQMEFASFKEAAKAPPVFITVVQEDDSLVDRYIPGNVYLAINELDEGHVGRFSLQSRESYLQVALNRSESLAVCLMAQLVHKNALICAIQQVHVCYQVTSVNLAPSRAENDTGSVGGNTPSNFLSVFHSVSSSRISSPNPVSSQLLNSMSANQMIPEAFVSLQLEKAPSRDLMINEFVEKKNLSPLMIKNPDEVEKLKRKLISEFCSRFNQRIGQYSLRGQLMAYYNSVIRLLEDFPIVRDKYFMIGESNEKKDIDEETALEPDARSFRKRVRAVMSEDGTSVFNIWFLPHHTELLIAYKKLSDVECFKALSHHLVIVASLHDILQYLCAHSRLGSAQARLGSRAKSQLAADWGGIDGIGTELREIQKQLDSLPVKTDPRLVGQLLSSRRDVMFLEFDVSIRHCVCDTFLSTANEPAFKAVTDCMRFALLDLSNALKPAVNATYINVPEPLIASETHATVLFPWRACISSHGPHPLQFWQWFQIEQNMRTCLSGLKDVDRQVANAEILSITLQMEDVLLTGVIDKATLTSTGDAEGDSSRRRRGSFRLSLPVVNQFNSASQNALSQRHQPIESYKLLKSFLLLWKRLEMLKYHWAKMKLGLLRIQNHSSYASYCKEYRKEILFPVLQFLARRYGKPDLYEGVVSELEPLIVPQGVSEMELKMRQVLKLMELFELLMVEEVRRKIQRDLTLSSAERNQDDSDLPTDLWKRPPIKEPLTIARSDISETFIGQLKAGLTEESGKIIIDAQHFNACLNMLATSIVAREKLAFESYSTFYENMLRINHQLLYRREQDIKQLKDQLRAHQNSMVIEVECLMADNSQQLLLEVMALRTKMAEMQDNNGVSEEQVRAQIRHEYDVLVEGLFSIIYELNHRLDEMRQEVCDGVFDRIAEIRSEATEALTRIAQRAGANADADLTQRNLSTSRQLRELQNENYRIGVLLMKQQSLSKWRLSCHHVLQKKTVSELKRKVEVYKKEKVRQDMTFVREKQFLSEQLKAVRSALKTSQIECDLVKKELEMELKERTDQSHVSQQQVLSLKKLEEARLEKIRKLHADLEDKNEKLQQLSEDQEKTRHLQSIAQEKIKKDADMVKKLLYHERNLKRDAFQRVDQLQSEINELEIVAQSNVRPQTSFSSILRSSRVSSAVRTPSAGQRVKSAGYHRPAAHHQRCMTAGPSELAARYQINEGTKKMQRPKTSIVSLRTRLAEQLLHDLEPPDQHEVLLKISRPPEDG